MSVYRRHITNTRYPQGNVIDVLALTEDGTGETIGVGVGRYLRAEERGEEVYAFETFHVIEEQMDEEEGMDRTAWNLFEKHLNRSKPLKIMHWTSLRQEGDTAGSYLNRRGDLVSSFDSLVGTMPREALDALITVQAKPIQNLPPCRLCRFDRDYISHDEENRATDEENVRHNLHILDNKLSVVGYEDGDEQTLFLGQEGQVTTQFFLRDVLIERSHDETVKVCIAQVNIYSKEDSKTTATVNANGRIVVEAGGDKDGAHTITAPLASLLPWIRVPSFLLPTNDGRVEIQEINFWMCPEECQTNTHYDGHHNMLMVLQGSKTVELSPPGTFRGSPVHGNHANHPFLLRCTDVGGHLHHQYFKHETSFFGPLRNMRENNTVVSVAAGEAIFIPEGWWHRVESSDDCVAINVWFDHKNSSLSSIVHDNNPHQLPYQARDIMRRYIDANIEEVNKSRQHSLNLQLLRQLGFEPCDGIGWIHDWIREPGQPIRLLFDAMTMSRPFPQERTHEEILSGMAIIERYASQILGVPGDGRGACSSHVQPLRHLALTLATEYLGNMISLFITRLDPYKQRDRIAIMSLLDSFPPITVNHQRQIFTSLVKSLSEGACFTLSMAWEKHGSVAEAEASYNSLFGRCTGDDGRKHFLKQVDDFRNESARQLILGDLMLLNPRPDYELEE